MSYWLGCTPTRSKSVHQMSYQWGRPLSGARSVGGPIQSQVWWGMGGSLSSLRSSGGPLLVPGLGGGGTLRPWDRPPCEQTKLKTLPSLTLCVWAVKTLKWQCRNEIDLNPTLALENYTPNPAPFTFTDT